ncbi:MAG: isoprenyl transferase [Deltaproteobacteria bacterium]|nr:isoprenyl transferase [Deltaproteobacteria bacterium]
MPSIIEENITKEKPPGHIAVIMDGNGRWARQRFLNRINGHKKGIEAARDLVKYCRELGIPYLTLYTFSRENWMRPAHEVDLLMGLLEAHLKGEEKMMMDNGIRFRAVGNVSELPSSVRETVAGLEARTSNNAEMTLQLALSYSGRDEIVHAAKVIASKAASGEIKPGDVNEELVSSFLYTAGAPDPDLLIRTSGEKRLSNFLLWQIAYTEIYIADVLWPDFNRGHLDAAIADYHSRERRFGLVKAEGTPAGAAG